MLTNISLQGDLKKKKPKWVFSAHLKIKKITKKLKLFLTKKNQEILTYRYLLRKKSSKKKSRKSSNLFFLVKHWIARRKSLSKKFKLKVFKRFQYKRVKFVLKKFLKKKKYWRKKLIKKNKTQIWFNNAAIYGYRFGYVIIRFEDWDWLLKKKHWKTKNQYALKKKIIPKRLYKKKFKPLLHKRKKVLYAFRFLKKLRFKKKYVFKYYCSKRFLSWKRLKFVKRKKRFLKKKGRRLNKTYLRSYNFFFKKVTSKKAIKSLNFSIKKKKNTKFKFFTKNLLSYRVLVRKRKTLVKKKIDKKRLNSIKFLIRKKNYPFLKNTKPLRINERFLLMLKERKFLMEDRGIKNLKKFCFLAKSQIKQRILRVKKDSSLLSNTFKHVLNTKNKLFLSYGQTFVNGHKTTKIIKKLKNFDLITFSKKPSFKKKVITNFVQKLKKNKLKNKSKSDRQYHINKALRNTIFFKPSHQNSFIKNKLSQNNYNVNQILQFYR